jgi:hypothetical protein
MSAALVPLLVVLVLLGVGLWVFQDAKRCTDEGAPVVLRVGSFAVETPAAWFVGCVLVVVVFFPLYMVSRAA